MISYENDDDEDELAARPYQVQLLDIAARQNTILFLPTGSGKTFVAIMLMKKLSTDLEKPYDEGGKRTFFMVNTVALVSQQAASIRRHTPFTVGEYSGDMNVDFWMKERWQAEVREHQILVMTSQIFLDMLLHTYIELKNTNLLIFDECHHGVNDHPMRQIMQRFETCPEREQPRILGLSATLILGTCKVHQVRQEVKNLENTFHSKVAAVDSMKTVAIFSTNPAESVVYYSNPSTCAVAEKAKLLINEYKDFVSRVKWPSAEIVSPPKGARVLYSQKVKTGKALCNMLEDLKLHIDMLGLYGGTRACLAHLVQLERRRCRCEDNNTEKLYTMLITGVTLVHKLLDDAMVAETDVERIKRYSSPKVITLFATLLSKYREKPPTEQDPFCCVVFVQRRFTAKILYYVLKALKADAAYSFLNPDFVVGFNNNPNQETREGKLESKRNVEVIYKFNKGYTNLMVSSDVLEEGIDVPRLSLVVKFDKPMNHSSYIQSKGRARHVSSDYVIMVSDDDQRDFQQRYSVYQQIEKELQNHLVGSTDARKAPTQKDIDAELYSHLEKPYYASGQAEAGSPCITLTSAIQLLNRYCSVLPQDKFTNLAPNWFLNHNGSVSVQLPMSSPLKDLITGLPMANKKLGKRSAALEACRRLHQVGEFDEQLLPKGAEAVLLEQVDLFPLWEDEKPEDDHSPRPGTKRKIRSYRRQFPCALSQCTPTSDTVTYLHKIGLQPAYPMPNKNRRIVFYEMLRSNRGYAILSSKSLPQVCEFSIYLNVGEVQVSVESDASQLVLSTADIDQLRRFNALLFNQVLSLEKTFLVSDVANEENAYLVAPTLGDEIDWDAVRTHTSVEKIAQPSVGERRAAAGVGDGYLHSVIAPWYRGALGDQNYVVTKVCHDMSPRSQFPSNDFISYETYYERKYFTKVLDSDQPLVEVKAISTKLQCLKPRSTAENRNQSRRKRLEMNEDFEEHLVPELCVRFAFPAVLWLKATCLPTVLHRLTNLLLAEELRSTISRDLGVGTVTLPAGTRWERFVADDNCDDKETKPEALLGIIKSAGPSRAATADRMWGDEREPVDIERLELENVRLVEIQYHEKFISKSLPPSPIKVATKCSDVPVYKIAMLANTIDGLGPQQFEILQALTATTANDIVNLERCETLGDAFLKLAVSQYLVQRYSSVDEGKLTWIKGKLLGNRNLFYCGREKQLGSIMKVYDFSPKSDFVPPSMCVPRFISQVIRAAELSPNVLYQLSIPEQERSSGIVSGATVESVKQQLIASEDEDHAPSTMVAFIGLQSVKDKTVADGVEALIGTYLRSSGVRGALLLLGWLGILPPERATPETMFDLPPPSALLVPGGDVNHHLRACNTLEERLGYRFRDRSFLLQALTHPSYASNRITENYQRLEFLGDALLDFLITCHLFERCGRLTPGQLTDLRSSLVNNVCFASLVVRLGFHQFMLAESPKLLDLIDKFVRLQEERGHAVCEQVLYLVEEKETSIAECVDVPKVLGDLFESLAGAVYLDSGMSLETVWDVFYKLMHNEIEEFSKKVPKPPVRLLYEHLGQNRPIFHKTVLVPESQVVMVRLEVIDRGEKCYFHGFGDNKLLARTAAAKIAMKALGTLAVK